MVGRASWRSVLASAVAACVLWHGAAGDGTYCITKVDPVDVVFVLDESTSVGKSAYLSLLTFVGRVAQGLAADSSRFGALEFSYRVGDEIDFTPDVEAFERSLGRLRYSRGATHTRYAVRHLARQYLTKPGNAKRPSSKRVVVFATDGNPDPRKREGGQNLIDAANELMLGGVDKLIFVKIGDRVNIDLFNGVVGFDPSSDVVPAEFNRLDEVIEEVISKTLCYTPDPTASPTAAPTGSPSVTPSKSPSLAPTASPSLAPTSARPTSSPSVTPSKSPSLAPTMAPIPTANPTSSPTEYGFCPDARVTLVMDRSYSINKRQMQKQRDVLFNLLDELHIQEDGTHVALVDFAKNYREILPISSMGTAASYDRASVISTVTNYVNLQTNGRSKWTNFLTILENIGPLAGQAGIAANSQTPNPTLVILSDGRPYTSRHGNGRGSIEDSCAAAQVFKSQYPSAKILCFQSDVKSRASVFYQCACDAVWLAKDPNFDDTARNIALQMRTFVCQPSSAEKLPDPCLAIQRDFEAGKTTIADRNTACKAVVRNNRGFEVGQDPAPQLGGPFREHCTRSDGKCVVVAKYAPLYRDDDA